eukprot:6209366-Pleurochrysis_carterae.AAC.2
MSSIGDRTGFVEAVRVGRRHLVLHGASRICARPKYEGPKSRRSVSQLRARHRPSGQATRSPRRHTLAYLALRPLSLVFPTSSARTCSPVSDEIMVEIGFHCAFAACAAADIIETLQLEKERLLVDFLTPLQVLAAISSQFGLLTLVQYARTAEASASACPLRCLRWIKNSKAETLSSSKALPNHLPLASPPLMSPTLTNTILAERRWR